MEDSEVTQTSFMGISNNRLVLYSKLFTFDVLS